MADLFRERKRWQLQDGPHGTLTRLRSQLAEDGCVDSQLIIAQKLLDEGKAKGDTNKEQEAVAWLLKAAQEDSTCAKQILNGCFAHQTGVTAKNYDDVIQCLSTSDVENIVRSAARKLYSELSVNDPTCENVTMLCKSGVIYKEDDLLDLASKIATGQQLDHAIDWEVQNQRVGQLTWREKLRNPRSYYSSIFSQVLDQLVSEGSGVLATVLYPSTIHLFVLFVLHITLCLEDMTSSMVPIFLFYFSYISLVISTLEMLHLHKWLCTLRKWIEIFDLESKNVNPQQFESLFVWNSNSTCYIRFFLSLIVLLLVYPVIIPNWVPVGECAILAAVFFVITFVAIGRKNDWLVTTSVTLHVFLMVFPRLILKLRSWDFIGDWMWSMATFHIGPYLWLHFAFPALFFTFVPLVFFTLLLRQSFFSIHRVLIPHLVSIFWLQLAVVFALDADYYSIIRGLFTIPILITLFPYLYYVFLLVFTLSLTFSFIFYSGFFPFLCILHICLFYQICLKNKRLLRLIRYGSIAGIILSLIPPLIVHFSANTPNWLTEYQPAQPTNLSWHDYYHHCHHPAWSSSSSLASVQYQCRILHGMPVSWEGSVLRVSVKKITNKLEYNVSFLPRLVGDWLRCVFGSRCPVGYRHECLEEHFCFCRFRPGECHLSSWDVYSFEVVLGMAHHADMADVFLEAGNDFLPFFKSVHRSDVIEVGGRLDDDVGGPRPTVRMNFVKCVSCMHQMDSVSVEESMDFSKSFRSVFHFFLAPIFEFRDGSKVY
uniref:Wolframin n=1 Tax=Strigamia maritima TaxID=126957 RepID=T1J9H9_STRMM